MQIKDIQYIKNISDLNEVILFLENGFKWSKIRSIELKEYLINNNTFPMGAYFKENDKLKIAVLIFNQGNYFKNKLKILNLSSWYALPETRGIKAVNFLNLLIKDLSNFTITNYSPTAQVYPIFKALKFRDMAVKHTQLGFKKSFPMVKLFCSEIKMFNNNLQKVKFVSLHEKYQKFDKENIKVYYRLRKIRIKNSFINLRIGDLYFDINENGPISFWLLLKFCFKYRCVQINLFNKSSDKYKFTVLRKNKYKWLVKDSDLTKDYIPPLGSEMCIKSWDIKNY